MARAQRPGETSGGDGRRRLGGGLANVADQRPGHCGPSKIACGAGQRLPVGTASPLENVDDGIGGSQRIQRDDARAELLAIHPVGQLVALGANDGQARPEAIEQPRAKREPGLQMVEVHRQRAVCRQQPAGPLLVRDPGVVEEHDPFAQAELPGARTRRVRGPALTLAQRRPSHEHEPCPRTALHHVRDRVDGAHGVEPVPQPAVPQHDLGGMLER